MQGISIVKAFIESPTGEGIIAPKPSLYIAVPSIIEKSGLFVLYPKSGRIQTFADNLESILVIRAFWGNDRDMVDKLVSNYFRDDDPSNLMNWLV